MEVTTTFGPVTVLSVTGYITSTHLRRITNEVETWIPARRFGAVHPVGAGLREDAHAGAAHRDADAANDGHTGATARLWDLTAPDPAAAPIVLHGHEKWVLAVAISPDNHWLVTGSDDATACLWDLTAQDPAAEPIVLRGHEDTIRAVAISPDNHWLITGSDDATARLWTLRLDELVDLACRTVGRNLTHEEWEQYLPWERYHKTCEQWPLEGK